LASERKLIRRARGGDQDAFSELVELHAGRVYGALRRFGLDPTEADEVAQEVFVRAWRALPRFQARARFSTWLYRIAFNEAQRRLSRRPPRRADRDDELGSVAAPSQPGPEAQSLDRELERKLEDALDELPSDLRTAVVLRDVEGLSTHQAAGIAGVGEGAFKSRLHRGRMQLRALLEPYLGLEEG
jgi:RNA polymerase sigma-70 factor (ECF subfamily)